MIIRDTPKGVGPAKQDQRDKEGHFVSVDADGNVALHTSATTMPDGVIEIGADTGCRTTYVMDSFQGTLEIKVADGSAAIAKNDLLALDATDPSTVKKAPASGARVIVAKAREAAVAKQLCICTLMPAQVYTA